MKNNGRKSDLSHRYHTRVIANIIYSTLVACLIDVFLVTNLTMLAEYAKRSEQSSAFLNMVAQSDVVVVLVYVLVGILVFAVTFLLLQEKSAAYISHISDAIERISDGDLNTQVEVVGDDEFSSMASNLNKMVEDIRRLMDKERESERTKNELITNVAHDLRTPLTAISGSISTVLEGDEVLTKQQKNELLLDAKKDAEWLCRMVENLLSITRMNGADMGGITKNDEILEEVLSEAVMAFKKRHDDVPVSVSVPDTMIFLPMDAMLIEQVLINLMDNAVVHGGNVSQIKINAREEDGKAIVSVADNGRGIDAETLPHLFDGSLQLSGNKSADTTRSMGIGLSVCKTIVAAHGGDIYAENLPEGGAMFTFTLPLGGTSYDNQG